MSDPDITIGSMEIFRLAEIEHCFVDVDWLFPSLSKDDMLQNMQWLGPNLIDVENRKLGFSFQSFVVKTPQHNILVDTCNGNHKQRPTALWQHNLKSNAYMQNLALLGLTPPDIDFVLCTHLHCDHVGWNTYLKDGCWVPTFPNARYIFGRDEYNYYAELHADDRKQPVNHGAFSDSVVPIVKAELADFVDHDHVVYQELDNLIHFSSSPGHSVGHVCIHAKSSDAEAIVCGDVMHHAIQFVIPDLVMRADFDPDQAIKTRKKLLTYCVESGAYLLAGHIPLATVSKVVRHGSSYRPLFKSS